MDNSITDLIKEILIWLIPCVPAITLHEVAHGWVAYRLGDPTAKEAKRLSLNPFRHIDPVGTVIVPGMMLLAHIPFVMGWAKPVPVDMRQVRGGRWGMILVTLAGPLANFLMLLFWLALWAFIRTKAETDWRHPTPGQIMFAEVVFSGAAINLVLILFNLFPLPPLDGGRIVGALLPGKLSRWFLRIDKIGMLILLVLVATGLFNRFFAPVVEYFFRQIGLL